MIGAVNQISLIWDRSNAKGQTCEMIIVAC